MYNQHAIQTQKIAICDPPRLTDNLVHRLPHVVIKLGANVQELCKDNGRLLAHDFSQCTYFFGTWFSTTYSKGHPPQIMTFHFIQQQRHQYVLLLTQESKSHKAVSSAGLQAVVPAGHVGSEAFTSDLQTEGLRTSLRSTPKNSFATVWVQNVMLLPFP